MTFAVLCEAFQRLEDEYVDPIDPSSLAAAAVLGIRNVPMPSDEPAGGLSGDRPSDVPCHIPAPAFEVVCAELVDRLAADGGSNSELGREIVQAAVQGMFRYGLDPFSVYIPDDGDGSDQGLTGFVYDLGIVVAAQDPTGSVCSPVGTGCDLTIVSVFDFTPADTAGIRTGDVILAVDGESVTGLAGEEAADRLSGTAGEVVVLDVRRDGVDSVFQMTRADIRFVPAEFEMVESDIAYVRLNEFSQPAAVMLGDVLQLPEVEDANGLILDLRDNPGGLVLAAQAVASQFLESGDVLIEEYRDGTIPIPVIEGGLATDGPPMVVLVNGASASAAEIVAAVLSETGRATTVGTATFGKNLVQFVHAARDSGELRITTARWKTPGGIDVGITGLQPDVVVEQSDEGDTQLEMALDLLG